MPQFGDPSGYYGNTTVSAMQQQAMFAASYGDQAAAYTQNRAAFGASTSAMMAGGGGGYQPAGGGGGFFENLGSSIMPITYTPPARVESGFAGQYAQPTGFFPSLFLATGIYEASRSASVYEQRLQAASDFGERVGGGVSAAMTSAGGLAFGMTAGRAIGGFFGGAVGSLLGPAGTAAGAFIGGEVGGFAMGMTGAQAVNEAVVARRDIQNFLEGQSFRFVGAGSGMADPRLGRGMSREARRETAEFIREADISDVTLDTGELSQILQQSTQLGLFAGTQDMSDFKSRFSDIVSNVKQVTRVLHETLEEGLQTLRDLKAVGVDPNEARAVIMEADSFGKVAGRTAGEMVNLGLQGAEIFRGTGVDMEIGMRTNMMNLASIRASRDAGILSQEAIAQAGGEEALAQRMTASSLAFTQSAFGRGFGATFFSAGGDGSGFDPRRFQNMIMGEQGFTDAAVQAAQNLGSPQKMIQYQANQEKFFSEAGKAFGGQGLQMFQNTAAMMKAQFMADVTGANVEDTFRLSMKEMGRSHSEIEAALASIRGARENFEANQAGAVSTLNKQVADEAIVNSDFYRLKERINDQVKGVVDTAARPLNAMVDNITLGAERFVEEQFLGIQRADVSDIDLDALGGVQLAPIDVGRINLDQGGTFSRTVGEGLIEAMEDPMFARNFGPGTTISGPGAKQGNLILRKGNRFTMEREVSITSEQLDNFAKGAELLGISVEEASRAQKNKELIKVEERIEQNFLREFGRGGLDDVQSGRDIAEIITGKALEEITPNEMKAVILQTQRSSVLSGIMKKSRTQAGTIKATQGSVGTFELQAVQNVVEEIKEDLSDEVGFDIAPGVLEKSALAGHLLERAERARSEGDIATAEKLERAAQKERSQAALTQSRFSEAETTEDLKKIRSGIEQFVGFTFDGKRALVPKSVEKDMHGIRGSLVALGQIQRKRGASALSGALQHDFMDEQLSDRDRLLVTDVADKIASDTTGQQLISLSEKERDILGKVPTGQAILKQRETLESLKSLKPGASKSDIEEVLQEQLRDKDQISRIVNTFQQDGADRAIQQAYGAFTQQLAGDRAVAGATGDRGTEGGTAQEDFARQTSINVQVLAALNALNNRLSSGG